MSEDGPSDPIRVVHVDDDAIEDMGLDQSLAILQQLTFDSGKLKVDAVVNMGLVTIGDVHLTDSVTDMPAVIKTDGVEAALTVNQNSQPLPTGASTSALQTSANTKLDALLTEMQTDQLPTGAATAALQTTGNTGLGDLLTELKIKADPTEQQLAGIKIFDTLSSTYKGLQFNAEAPQICSQDYLQAIAEGDIVLHTPWEKIGYTPTMTTTESPIWSKAGAYVYPAAGGIQMAVSSSNIGNDIAAGTGCQKVTIKYLDDTYTEQTEDVTMHVSNGQTRVNTVAIDILRVQSFSVKQVGAGGVPAGNISLTNTGGTVTYSYITFGYTKARNSHYCVPAGKTLYVVSAHMGYGFSTNQTHYARLYVRANQNEGVLIPGIFYPFAEVLSANATIPLSFGMPLKFVEKVDVYCGGISTFSGIATSVMRGWLE